jgi:hypothetical protein
MVDISELRRGERWTFLNLPRGKGGDEPESASEHQYV